MAFAKEMVLLKSTRALNLLELFNDFTSTEKGQFGTRRMGIGVVPVLFSILIDYLVRKVLGDKGRKDKSGLGRIGARPSELNYRQ